MAETIVTRDVRGCSACGEDHRDLAFTALSTDPVWPYMAVCPNTGWTVYGTKYNEKLTTDTPFEKDCESAAAVRRLCQGHPHAKIPWPHYALHAAADEINRLVDLVKHWRCNHDNQVQLNRTLRERTDLPELRSQTHDELALVVEENRRLRRVVDRVSPSLTYEEHSHYSLPFWKSVGFFFLDFHDRPSQGVTSTFFVLQLPFNTHVAVRSVWFIKLMRLFKRPKASSSVVQRIERENRYAHRGLVSLLESTEEWCLLRMADGATEAMAKTCMMLDLNPPFDRNQVAMAGSFEQCYEYAYDEGYQWQATDCAPNVCEGYFWRPPDADSGAKSSALVPVLCSRLRPVSNETDTTDTN